MNLAEVEQLSPSLFPFNKTVNLPPLSDDDYDNERQKQLKRTYGQLYSATEALFYRYDPIEIAFGTNPDEYDPEVNTVLPRLASCSSAADVQRVVHEEFCRWFGVDSAGSFDCYAPIASELWQLWHEFNTQTRNA